MTFCYPALPPDGEHFRLIRLYADQPDDYVRCDLFTARRSEWKSRYYALSYVWGESSPMTAISVNGIAFQVRDNLFGFFGSFRAIIRQQDVKSAVLWIDAMSINQDCTDEKNHQVQVMGHIYQEAERVYAWLGEGDREVELVLWLGSQAPSRDRYAGSTRQWIENSAKEFLAFAHQHDQHKVWCSRLQQLSVLRYWKRIWTIQEQALAPDLVYIFNAQCCGVEGMVYISKTLNDPENSPFFHYVIGMRHNQQSSGVNSLWLDEQADFRTLASLFGLYSTWEASLPFDKVYALVGLLKAEDAVKIAVDYRCGKMDLLALLLRTGLLSFEDVPNLIRAISLSSADLELFKSDEEISVAIRYAHMTRFQLPRTEAGRARTVGRALECFGSTAFDTEVLTTDSADQQLSVNESMEVWGQPWGYKIGDEDYLEPGTLAFSVLDLLFGIVGNDKGVVIGLALPKDIYEVVSQNDLTSLQQSLTRLSHCGGSLDLRMDDNGYYTCLWQASIPISAIAEFWYEYLAVHQAIVDARPIKEESDESSLEDL